MTPAKLCSTMYRAERSIPAEAGVEADTTNFTVAPGATPPDHSSIQIGLSFLAKGGDARIFSIQNHIRGIEIRRQPEHRSKLLHVLDIKVGFANDRDGLTGTVDLRAAINEWQSVVDRRKIPRA